MPHPTSQHKEYYPALQHLKLQPFFFGHEACARPVDLLLILYRTASGKNLIPDTTSRRLEANRIISEQGIRKKLYSQQEATSCSW
jgi:hypothetical protein